MTSGAEPPAAPATSIDEVFRTEWPRLVARLVRDVGDVGLAEDAAQEAFVEAARRWETVGAPDVPAAWLLTTARRKAIDALRRSKRLSERLNDLVEQERLDTTDGNSLGVGHEALDLVDDQLALLLGCCHPALSPEAQVALTLRIVGGLSSAQIARAFFVSESTMVRRITRSKTKIRETNIAFGRANLATLHERLPTLMAVVYSIFTEGHASANAPSLVRGDLCDEAIWLGTLLHELVPGDAEVAGLLALMLLIDARRASRVDDVGMPVRLADQDRTGWNADQIARGLSTLARAHAVQRGGPYQLQAAVAALHATAPTYDDTDWNGIISLYDVMLRRQPTAVLALNRAIAIYRRDGAQAGLDAIEEIGSDQLTRYPYVFSARAEMLVDLGRVDEGRAAFEEALSRSENEVEQAHLRRRIAAMSDEEPAK